MKKLILFGAGEFGLRWLNKLGSDKVFAYADFNRNKVGSVLEGKRILSIEEICNLEDEKVIFISTSDKYKYEIETELIKFGLSQFIVDTPYWEKDNYVAINASIDENSFLEGKNAVFDGTIIKESYIGYASYVSIETILISAKIGRYCAIGPYVKIIRGQHPTKNFVSIYPGFYSANNATPRISFTKENLFEEYRYAEYPYAVAIGNDVWIGYGAKIMEGVTIADGTIVAAGAVVVRDTEKYTIVGGVPAKKIGERFSEEDKEFLIGLKWWDKSEDWIQSHACYFNDVRQLKRSIDRQL